METFSTQFIWKFMLFWITQRLTLFTHPNIKIAKNKQSWWICQGWNKLVDCMMLLFIHNKCYKVTRRTSLFRAVALISFKWHGMWNESQKYYTLWQYEHCVTKWTQSVRCWKVKCFKKISTSFWSAGIWKHILPLMPAWDGLKNSSLDTCYE